jgi:FkbM family methyltransferase
VDAVQADQCYQHSYTLFPNRVDTCIKAGGNTVRFNHHDYIPSNSLVIDVGGNVGSDTAALVRLYPYARYIVLEPLEQYFKVLKKRFQYNNAITVLNIGLGRNTDIVNVIYRGHNAEATSMFKTAHQSEQQTAQLRIKNTLEFLVALGVGQFDADLMTINCEGCEFEMLEDVTMSPLIGHVRNIQYQSHAELLPGGIGHGFTRYCRLNQLLARTHVRTFEFPYVWVNWRRKDLLN